MVPVDPRDDFHHLPSIERTFSARLKSAYGEGRDPEVSLDREEGEAESSYYSLSLAPPGPDVEPAERYTLFGEIARGGMGAILKVFDNDLRRSLAMKVILSQDRALGANPAESVDPNVLSRFLEEAQVTSQLDHPGVVPVHELGIDAEGRVYFTMQLVRGRDLRHFYKKVRDGGWTVTRALNVLLKVCEAMAFAHSRNVVHRDLKPANVMVGRYGEVYVMDWGLARVLSRRERDRGAAAAAGGEGVVRTSPLDTLDGTVIGTPFYMPPEQAAGRLADIGPASDVYAVGAMLYELLAGTKPYLTEGQRPHPRAVLAMVMQGPPQPLHEVAPDAPMELVAICERAMEREIGARYPSMEALADDLRAWLEGRVVKAYETGAAAELRKWVQRNRGMAAASMAALVLLVVGLAVSLFFFVESERNASQVLRLADVKRLDDLELEARELWPPYPELEQRYLDWLRRAEDLVQRADLHRQTLAGLFAGGHSTEEEEWQYVTLEGLLADLDEFARPDGLLDNVRGRLAFAREVERETITGSAVADQWARAVASIADPAQCPAYEGLEIRPQRGLVPLGRDPDSGLWEFAHLQSGKIPARNAAGRIVPDGEMGLVLVLLPGGTFHMGASPVPGTRNYDPDAQGEEKIAPEVPVHAIRLDPFFVSKYEMTQGQWQRITGTNPSTFQDYRTSAGAVAYATPRSPVETVTWYDCNDVMHWLDLALPTEAQWEYAARGGTDTPWWTGVAKETIEGAANIADTTCMLNGGQPNWQYELWLDDRYTIHAPVGLFRANPYGLHDTMGNVWEWCLEWFDYYADAPARDGDGYREPGYQQSHVYRGGGWGDNAFMQRSANRFYETRELHMSIGVRPARRLDR